MLKGFPPVIDKNVKIMVLGSFPGNKSLEKQEYYAHPQNQFWKLIGDIINEPLHDYSYEKKKKSLLKHNIGLWDVIDVCQREGSLDIKIKEEKANPIETIHNLAPNVQKILFNGKKAASYEKYFQNIKTFVLPSTSPANTTSYKEKLSAWKQAFRKKF